METSTVKVSFPATPDHLRLARITTADAASRAGLDYEEIDDARIAVSELCSVVSVDATTIVTLQFRADPGVLVVEGASATGAAAIALNELSATIVGAVVDEYVLETVDGVTRFRITKSARRPLSS